MRTNPSRSDLTISTIPTGLQDTAALQTISKAFSKDPLFDWILNHNVQPSSMLWLWEKRLRLLPKQSRTFSSYDRSVVSIWYPVSIKPISGPLDYLRIGLAWAPIVVGCQATMRAIKSESFIEDRWPTLDSDGVILDTLAVAPEHQGKGLGSRMLQDALSHFQGKEVSLVTTNRLNIAFYQSFGFDIHKLQRLSDNGPHCWWMIRK